MQISVLRLQPPMWTTIAQLDPGVNPVRLDGIHHLDLALRE